MMDNFSLRYQLIVHISSSIDPIPASQILETWPIPVQRKKGLPMVVAHTH